MNFKIPHKIEDKFKFVNLCDASLCGSIGVRMDNLIHERVSGKFAIDEILKEAELEIKEKYDDQFGESKHCLWRGEFWGKLMLSAVRTCIVKKDEKLKEEVEYQFLLHVRYLFDTSTGLWYHGWTFNGNHNFAGAFWGRGNCWVTMAIPEFLSMIDCSNATAKELQEALCKQVESLVKYQAENGMWHTLIDDPTSYVEASATCGFAYGILKAVKEGLVDASYKEVALKAVAPILECIAEDGVVHQVSYGTPMGRIDKDFYKNIELKPMPYGQALAMLFLAEYLNQE